jgi:hypothetical protein
LILKTDGHRYLEEQFVLFEVGRANVGDARKRPLAAELITVRNTVLKADGVRLTGSVGHTGNYIAETTGDLATSDLTAIFLRLKVRMAVFPEVEFRSWVSAAHDAFGVRPLTPSDRRPTAGVVMNLDPNGGIPPEPPSSDKVNFASFAVPRVRGVWKLDVLRPDGRGLDAKKREGGWGNISSIMRQHEGGGWTARSMRTINGLASRLTSKSSDSYAGAGW